METLSFGQRVKRTSVKILRRTLIVILVVAVAAFAFLYWGVYDEGIVAGKVLRISKKGVMFKTYEGKINLETFGALRNTSPIAESYDFSVEKSDQDVIKQLEEVSLTGERINLHFVKRYMMFPWRGETKVFATSVERGVPAPAK